METNLKIDDALLKKALGLGGHRTKKATVTEALQEYIRQREQWLVIGKFGTIDYDPKYDYKSLRKRR